MIDLFSLALCHGLLLVAALRLLKRDDLDDETTSNSGETSTSPRWGRPRA